MVTIKPTMNLMALLKAGVVIEFLDRMLKIQVENGRIVVRREVATAWEWEKCGDFQLNKDGLIEAVEYVNLPF